MKPALLFLSHRIPYPPNKGDKIRSFHLLEYLARRYRIHLGSFVDDPDDWQHLPALDRWCERRMVRPLRPVTARLKSLAGLATGEPLTLPYYRDGRLSAWVRQVLEEQDVGHVLIYSSAMAQYLLGEEGWRGRVVMDLVDVDSDKWRQYAQSRSWPMSWIYRREAERLLRFERTAGAAFDATLLVSEEEAALFRRLAPEVAPRVHALRNGVDVAYFDPALEHPSPYEGPGPHLVFTGAMDYWPNVDAVVWFVEEVMPRLRARFPRLEFHVVGSRPTERVRELAGDGYSPLHRPRGCRGGAHAHRPRYPEQGAGGHGHGATGGGVAHGRRGDRGRDRTRAAGGGVGRSVRRGACRPAAGQETGGGARPGSA